MQQPPSPGNSVPRPASAPPRLPAVPPDRMPRTAVAAGALGIVGAAPLAVLVPLLSAPGDGGPFDGARWVLLVAFPLLQAGGAVLLLYRLSWLALALACLPGLALMALLFLVSGPDFPAFLGSLVQLGVGTLTVCCAAHPDVRDWVAGRASPPPGGRRQPAPAR